MNTYTDPLTRMPVPDSIMHVFGYYLSTGTSPFNLGTCELLVAMRAKPTVQHFDPEKMILSVVGANGQPEKITLEQRTSVRGIGKHVCFGKVTLVDRLDKKVEFFTFGGTLEVIAQPTATIFHVRSSAPILSLPADTESLSSQFVAEVEAHMSVLQAHNTARASKFEHQLGTCDAKTLYEAMVRGLLKEYTVSPVMRRMYPELYHLLVRLGNELEQASRGQVAGPSLEELLTLSTPVGNAV